MIIEMDQLEEGEDAIPLAEIKCKRETLKKPPAEVNVRLQEKADAAAARLSQQGSEHTLQSCSSPHKPNESEANRSPKQNVQ